jgi:lipid A 3-O-deacylase
MRVPGVRLATPILTGRTAVTVRCVVFKIRKAVRGAFFGVALVLCGIQPSPAVDGIAVVHGEGRSSDMLRVGAQWQWGERWLQGERAHLGGFWDLGIARWRREEASGQQDSLSEISLTPVFRFQANDRQGVYVEGGIGLHLLSATRLGNKRYSTAFQFGEHLGFGYRFAAFEFGYRYQHISNADIKTPNSGADFHQLRLQYWFR